MTRARESVAVAILALAMVLVIAPVTANAQADTPIVESAKGTLRQCLSGTNRLEVLFLIDESRSLTSNDRDNQRVGGVKAALAALAQIGATRGGDREPPVVDVLFASFAGEVRPDPFADEPVNAWRPLTDASLGALQQQADTYATLNTGHNTDYLKALKAARELFSQRAFELTRSGAASPCKLLVWFTDGAYEISGDPGAVKTGRQDLCRSGGVIDGLAKDKIVTLTIGLRTGLGDLEERRLRAMTEGRGGGEDCGTQASTRTGLYRSVTQSSQLFLELGDLLDDVEPPPSPPVCINDVRRDACLVGFATVTGVTRFVIRASTGGAGIQLDLAGPVGQPVRFTPGATEPITVAGTSVTQTWVSPTDVTLTGTLNTTSADGIGAWSFAFVDPGATQAEARPGYRVQVFADLAPALAAGTSLVRGQATDLPFSIVDSSGRPVTSGPLVEKAALDVTHTDPTTATSQRARVRPGGGGRYLANITVPAESPSGYAYVDADLRFDTPSGVSLVAEHRTYTVDVKFPKDGGYPSVEPIPLQLRAIEDDGSSKGDLVVKGSSIGGGCIWFGPAQITVPDGDGRLEIPTPGDLNARGRCRRVKRDEEIKIPVTADVRAPFTGHASAKLPVSLTSERRGEVARLDLEVDVDVAKSPNTTLLVGVFVVLALLSVVIPIALLMGLNWLTARFTPKQRVSARALDVRLRDGGPLDEIVDGEAVRPDVRMSTFRALSVTRGTSRERELRIDEKLRLRSYGSFGPRGKLSGIFLGPYGAATAMDQRVISGGDQKLERYERAAEIPLDLPGTWLFYPTLSSTGAADSSEARIEGRLVLLTSDRRGDDGGALLGGAESGIAALWRELAGLAHSPEGSDGPTQAAPPEQQEEPPPPRTRGFLNDD